MGVFSKVNGWGISSTTITPTPFHSYTKSPDVKHVRMSHKDRNAPLPAIHEHDVAKAPRHAGNGSAPPLTAAQWKLGRKLREANAVARMAAEHAHDAARNHHSLLNKAAYFRFHAQAAKAAKAALAAQLDALHAELGDNPALPPEVRGAEMLVVTQAVALACRRHDPEIAARALACLREVDLLGSIARPEESRPSGFSPEETAAAWRIAQALELTPLGFACLKKIARPAHDGQPVHASLASHADTILHAFLKASREKTRLDRQLAPDPRAVLGDIPDRPRSLLDKSLRAAQVHLAQAAGHAQAQPEQPFKPPCAEHEWAIGAVNNGFYTDQRKDDKGRTTPFYKAEQRLRKMSKWVARASGTGHADADGSNPEALGKQASAARKTARFLRNTLLPKMKKSPFNAVNRQAPAILPFAGVEHGSALRNAEGGGLGEARALETPSLKTISKADTSHLIGQPTRNHALGSRVVLYSGGVAGFGARQLTGVFSKLISAGFLRVNADLKGERARCATVEIGTGPQGNELFLGTQRMLTGQGGGLNGAAGMEGTGKQGVMVRFERISTGTPGDPANNAKLGRLAARLMAPGALPDGDPWVNAPGEDADSLLKNLLQEWPEVSIGLVESSDKAGHANAGAHAVAGARFGGLQLGLGHLGASIAARFRGRSESTETGGALRVEKKAKFWNAKASVAASVAALGTVIDIDGADLDPGLSFVERMGASVGVWKNGYTETDTLIEYQGELKKNSVRIKAHQNAASFVDSVAPELDAWAEAKTRRFNPDGYGALAPPDETPAEEQLRIQKRNAAIEAEHTILREHLQRSLDHAEPTQSFWEFKEIRADAAAAANALKSVATMAAACGDKPAVKDCEKARAKLLASEEAWEPTFLIDTETTTAQRTLAPVNFIVKPQQLDGINAGNARIFS